MGIIACLLYNAFWPTLQFVQCYVTLFKASVCSLVDSTLLIVCCISFFLDSLSLVEIIAVYRRTMFILIFLFCWIWHLIVLINAR